MAESAQVQKPDSKPNVATRQAGEVVETAEKLQAPVDFAALKFAGTQNNRRQARTVLQMQRLLGNQSVLRLVQSPEGQHTEKQDENAQRIHPMRQDSSDAREGHLRRSSSEVAGKGRSSNTSTPNRHKTAERDIQQQDAGVGDEFAAEAWDVSFASGADTDRPGIGESPSILPSLTQNSVLQRISLDDLDPTAIIDQVREFLNIGEDAGEDAESATETEAEATKEAVQEAADTLETETRQTTEQSDEIAQEADQQQTQVENQADEGQSQVSEAKTQATNQLTSVGAAVRPALSLANQVANPTAATAPATQIAGLGQPLTADTEAMQAVGERVGGAVERGLAADGKEGWNCDEAEVLGIATELGREALDSLIRAADDLTDGGASRLIEFAGEIGTRLRKTAEEIMRSVRDLGKVISSSIEELTRPLVDAVREGMDAVRDAYNDAKRFISETWEDLKTSFVEGWNDLKQAARNWMNEQIASARRTIQNAINRASSIINSVGSTIRDMLPDWVLEGVDELRDTISSVQETISEGIDDAIEWAGEVKDQALEDARELADDALQTATEAYRAAGELKDELVEEIREAGREAVEMIPQPIRDAASDASEFVGEQVDKVKDAAGEVLEEVSGAVCKPVNDIAAPCLDRYLPFGGDVTSSSVALSSANSVTVPLHEIGVPANAEIGEGSSITLSRTGQSTYTLKVSGDSSIMFTEKQADPNLSVGIDLPTGQNAKGTEIWRRLTSGGPSAGGQAPQGQQQGQGGGAGGGASVEAKAGIKRNISVTYTFDTNGTCDLASLAGVLAAYGVSGALSSVAPSPFSDIISGAGSVATGIAFNSYITNISMTNTLAGEASAGLASGDAGSLKLGGTAEASQTLSLDRNEEGDLVPTTKYSVSIGGQLAGKLNLDGLMTAGGSLGAKGTVSLTLGYNGGDITPQKLEAAVEASLAMNGFSVANLPVVHLPGDAPSTIERQLERLRQLGVNGSLKAELKYTVPLEGIVVALRNYFDTEPIDSITWGGVMDIVTDQFNANPPTTTFKLTLTETSRIGVSVSGGVSAEGAAIGFSGSASASHNVVHQLYPAPGGSTTPQPVEPPVAPPIPEPHPEPEHPGPQPDHPTPQPPSVPPTIPIEEARRQVQESSQQIAELIRQRETGSEDEKARIDREIAEIQRRRQDALIRVVLEENPNAEVVDRERGIYRVRVVDGEGRERYLYGSISVVWQLREVSPSVFTLGASLQADPPTENLPPETTVTTRMGVGGSGIQSAAQPFPGDIDFAEEIEIRAPDAQAAATATYETILEFVRRNANHEDIEFQHVNITGGPPEGFSFDELMDPDNRDRIINLLANLRAANGNVNTFWRARTAGDRFIEVTKILSIRALDNNTGESLFSTRESGAEFQMAYFDDPGQVQPTNLGQYASEMRKQAIRLSDQGKYLKAAKRAFNYAMCTGNLEGMEAIRPAFRTNEARVNQETAILSAIADALNPDAETRVLQVAEAQRMIQNAAQIVESHLPGTGNPPPAEIAADLRALAEELRGDDTGILRSDPALQARLGHRNHQIEEQVHQGLQALVQPVIDRYVR